MYFFLRPSNLYFCLTFFPSFGFFLNAYIPNNECMPLRPPTRPSGRPSLRRSTILRPFVCPSVLPTDRVSETCPQGQGPHHIPILTHPVRRQRRHHFAGVPPGFDRLHRDRGDDHRSFSGALCPLESRRGGRRRWGEVDRARGLENEVRVGRPRQCPLLDSPMELEP